LQLDYDLWQALHKDRTRVERFASVSNSEPIAASA